MFTEVYLEKEVAAARCRLVKTLSLLRGEVQEEVLVSVGDRCVVHTNFQFIFNLKLKDPIEAKILELLVEHSLSAERMGPGAFDACLQAFIDRADPEAPSSGDFLARTPTWEEARRIALDRLRGVDDVLHDLVSTGLELAGFGGKVVVEKTHGQDPSAELTRGYTFDVTPGWPNSSYFEDVRVFVVDGFVEQVSEVHHLLQAASEAKEPAVIFVRGMSEEVLHTLRVNFDRGTLKVMPVVVKFDLDGINTVNDLAVVAGCDLVSSNKGDLISSVKFEDAPRVRSVGVYPNKVIVQNEGTAARVAAHVKFLRDKRNAASAVEDVGLMYDRRIRSLSPNCVTLRIPNTKDFVRRSQAVDQALRTLRSLVDFGLDRQDGRPLAAKVAAQLYSKKLNECLRSLGAVLLTDRAC